MLGIIKHSPILRSHVGYGIADEVKIFRERNTQCVGDVERPGLSKEGNDLGLGIQERLEVGIMVYRMVGLPRRAKCDHRGLMQRNGLDYPEEFDVFGVGSRPSAFDEMDAEFVQPLRDSHLVFCRERHIFRLGSVTQRRVIDLQGSGSDRSNLYLRNCKWRTSMQSLFGDVLGHEESR